MKAWERLINYVTVRTPSDEESETVPSSVCQFDLARKLEKEMKELGLTEVVLDDKYVLEYEGKFYKVGTVRQEVIHVTFMLDEFANVVLSALLAWHLPHLARRIGT